MSNVATSVKIEMDSSSVKQTNEELSKTTKQSQDLEKSTTNVNKGLGDTAKAIGIGIAAAAAAAAAAVALLNDAFGDVDDIVSDVGFALEDDVLDNLLYIQNVQREGEVARKTANAEWLAENAHISEGLEEINNFADAIKRQILDGIVVGWDATNKFVTDNKETLDAIWDVVTRIGNVIKNSLIVGFDALLSSINWVWTQLKNIYEGLRSALSFLGVEIPALTEVTKALVETTLNIEKSVNAAGDGIIENITKTENLALGFDKVAGAADSINDSILRTKNNLVDVVDINGELIEQMTQGDAMRKEAEDAIALRYERYYRDQLTREERNLQRLQTRQNVLNGIIANEEAGSNNAILAQKELLILEEARGAIKQTIIDKALEETEKNVEQVNELGAIMDDVFSSVFGSISREAQQAYEAINGIIQLLQMAGMLSGSGGFGGFFGGGVGSFGAAGFSMGNVNVTVNGGTTNAQTASAVSDSLVDTMRGIAVGEISTQQRAGGLLYGGIV